VLLRMEVAAFHPPSVKYARGLVSVALFVTFAPLARRLCVPGCYPASCSAEPGLSSTRA
jgi:hypothetical protein